MKITTFALLIAVGLSQPFHAHAADFELTTEQQREVVSRFAMLYSNLNPDQRAFALPLIANAIDGNLPMRDPQRGIEVRQFRAAPNETLAMRVRWLQELGTDGPSVQDTQAMLPMLVTGMGCKDESVREIVNAGIKIRIDVESLKGQSLATTVLDAPTCNKVAASVEDQLDRLGVDDVSERGAD